MHQFTVGQLITCVMYEGVFVVHAIAKWDSSVGTFYRYTIRRGNEFISDNPGVWLTPARILRPQLGLASVNEFPLATLSRSANVGLNKERNNHVENQKGN